MKNMLWLENNNNNNNLFFFFLLLHKIHINTSTMIIMKTEPGYIFQQFKNKTLSLLGEMRDSFLLYLSRLTSFLLYLTRLTSIRISYLYCFFFQLMQVLSFQRATACLMPSVNSGSQPLFSFPPTFVFTNSTYVCVCVCLHATHTQTPINRER